MAKRKTITPSVRFEVFKRDSFKCQYCGKKSPDIILEVDHIQPVSAGGTNEIINLLTSCYECNRGKGKKKLSDNSSIDKQRSQLELLQERRNQLDMLLKWKTDVSNGSKQEIKKVHDYFTNLTNCILNESGEKKLKAWVLKYGASSVIESIEESYNKYYDPLRDKDNAEFIFSKINSICYEKTLTPDQKETSDMVRLILKIARGKFYYQWDYNEAIIAIKRFMNTYDNIDRLAEITLESEKFSEWKGMLYA